VDDTTLKKNRFQAAFPIKKTDSLIAEANNAGKHDNITVILIEML